MIPNDQPARGNMIQRMVNHLEELIPNQAFTKWEEDFITSCAKQFRSRHDLSQRQCEIIERLYDK